MKGAFAHKDVCCLQVGIFERRCSRSMSPSVNKSSVVRHRFQQQRAARMVLRAEASGDDKQNTQLVCFHLLVQTQQLHVLINTHLKSRDAVSKMVLQDSWSAYFTRRWAVDATQYVWARTSTSATIMNVTALFHVFAMLLRHPESPALPWARW